MQVLFVLLAAGLVSQCLGQSKELDTDFWKGAIGREFDEAHTQCVQFNRENYSIDFNCAVGSRARVYCQDIVSNLAIISSTCEDANGILTTYFEIGVTCAGAASYWQSQGLAVDDDADVAHDYGTFPECFVSQACADQYEQCNDVTVGIQEALGRWLESAYEELGARNVICEGEGVTVSVIRECPSSTVSSTSAASWPAFSPAVMVSIASLLVPLGEI